MESMILAMKALVALRFSGIRNIRLKEPVNVPAEPVRFASQTPAQGTLGNRGRSSLLFAVSIPLLTMTDSTVSDLA